MEIHSRKSLLKKINQEVQKSDTNHASIWNKLICNIPSTNTSATTSVSYVFILNKDAPLETRTYLLTTLLNNALNVQLIASSFSPGEVNFQEDLVLLITCEVETIQEYAELVCRPQQVGLRNFVAPNQQLNLSVSEQQKVLLHMLEAITQKERSTLVGLNNVTIYPGQSIGMINNIECIFNFYINIIFFNIVQICHREKVLLHYFPLHQTTTLNELKSNWCYQFAYNVGWFDFY